MRRGRQRGKCGKSKKKSKKSKDHVVPSAATAAKALKKRIDKKRSFKLGKVEDYGSSGGLRESDLLSLGGGRLRAQDDDDSWDSDEAASDLSSMSLFSTLSIGERVSDPRTQQAAFDELTEHFADIESKELSL